MADAPVGGRAFTVEQLFSEHQFGLDHYQREFIWDREAVQILLADLLRRFRASWRPTDSREAAANYEPYFLGPFVYFQDGGTTYLVDGQQRITTLHLLLLHMRGLLKEQEEVADVAELDKLIAKTKFGKRTFSVNIAERAELLESLHRGKPYELPRNPTPSVRNLYERAMDLDEDFPVALRDDALPYFLDWMRDRVCLVGIRALSRNHGWEIFETMNDRGSRLTPVDLLKGFLIGKVSHGRESLNRKWRAMLTLLPVHGSGTPSDFIKTLLLARYADLGNSEDRTAIELAAHEWVRKNVARLGLSAEDDYRRFIEDELCALAEHYNTAMTASQVPDFDREAIFYNTKNGLSKQFLLILAVLNPNDSTADARVKTGLVAAYLDVLYVLKFVNASISRSDDLDAEVFELVPLVRNCGGQAELRAMLGHRIADLQEDFAGLGTFGLRPDARPQVRYLLARITAFVDVGCGEVNRVVEYLDKQRPHEIEHIWANKFPRYQHLVGNQANFNSWRNRLGALLLLNKSDNASFNADTYVEKLPYYFRQNVLAKSLNPLAYRKFSKFSSFRKKYDLEGVFKPYSNDFDLDSIKERQKLYQRLCEIVWNPENLGFDLPKQELLERRVARRTRARYDTTLAELIDIGLLKPNDALVGRNRGNDYEAEVQVDGRIRVPSGEMFSAPSPAAMFVLQRQSCNGWTFWQVIRDGCKRTLKSVRDEALSSGALETTPSS
jgi:hypothetical protein